MRNPSLWWSVSFEGLSFLVIVQLFSHVQFFATPWTAARQASLSFTICRRWVGDVIQPSHPLLSPSPTALSLSQHQHLFQWVSSSYLVAKLLELQLQRQSFQWIFRVDFFRDWLDVIMRSRFWGMESVRKKWRRTVVLLTSYYRLWWNQRHLTRKICMCPTIQLWSADLRVYIWIKIAIYFSRFLSQKCILSL